MYVRVEKPTENQRKVIANAVAQKKSYAKQGFVNDRIKGTLNNKIIQRGGNNSKPAPLDNNLLPWDGAVSVGYHGTKAWDKIKESGEFKPGGGKLGIGIYAATNKQLASMYGALGNGDDVTLEVGFKGDFEKLKTIHLNNVNEYKAEMEGKYDAIYVDHNVIGQVCFKLNGPANLTADHIRVRKI